MTAAIAIGVFIVGIIFGFGIAYALKLIHTKTAREIAGELFRESEDRRKESIDTVVGNIKESFGNLSLEALSKSTEEFIKLADQKFKSDRELNTQELDKKKELIGEQLTAMNTQLENVSKLMNTLEKDREQKFGELTKQLETAGKQTSELIKTTGTLSEALASSSARGQWGERMAEDVLRVAGFVDKVNYIKQKAIEGSGNKPDFTFFLPRDLKLNMDVKFPYANYVRFIETDSDVEKELYLKTFLKDVKLHIKEVSTRDYINPEQNTVDYVLLFIPNEQIYAFIYEHDYSILDYSIEQKVIMCSPITLFAVLAVVRQAVDNFTFEKTSHEILTQLSVFYNQWNKFKDSLQKLGKRINDTHTEFEALSGTRVRQLEKPLNRIEEIRLKRGIPDENGELPEIGE